MRRNNVMNIAVDNGTWRPVQLGRVGTPYYRRLHSILKILRFAPRPLTNREIRERMNPNLLGSSHDGIYIAKALVHLEKGGLVRRPEAGQRSPWILTRQGMRAWKQIGQLRAQRLEQLRSPQVEPVNPIDPELYNLVYVRINLTGEGRFDIRIVPMLKTFIGGTIEREQLTRDFLKEKLEDGSIAQVLRLSGQSGTIELPPEAYKDKADGGLIAVHVLTDELEDLINRDAVYYVFPRERAYRDLCSEF
jgi:hypothetical protein